MWRVWITVIGFLVGCIATTLGAATVFVLKKEISAKANALLTGTAAGIMLAASVWSLLLPAIEQATARIGGISAIFIAISVMFGGMLLTLLRLIELKYFQQNTVLGVFSGRNGQSYMRMFIAVTLHNIPEGLAVGFAFDIASINGSFSAYLSALGLAIGIGAQNFPEGAAISLPMQSACGKRAAFLWGAGSGIVEPICSVVGYFLSTVISFLQPWLLSFAAGAMIFVSAQDLIPVAGKEEQWHIGAWGVLIGFVVMMLLDVTLG